MYTIPYFLKDELKNRLISKISAFSDSFVDTIVNNLTNPNIQNKYIDIISIIHRDTRKLIADIIKDIFECLDNKYKESEDRKKFYTINKSNVERTITTIFGDVTFKRTYYLSKIDDEPHFILDEALNLPKYDRYDPIVKGMAVDLYSKTNLSLSGQIIGNTLTDLPNLGNNEALKTIPRQSVYNWIKDWNNPKINFQERKTPKILYVMSDEKYIGCQDQDNDIMIKSFVVFEGVEKVSKGRNKLKNKIVLNMISKQPWVEFSDTLFQIYNSREIEKIYLLGDGANWIKSGLSELKVEPEMEIKHLLCEFHFKQAIHHITSDEDYREILLLSFKNDTKKQFDSFVEEIKKENPNRLDIIEKKRNYIFNNYQAIKDMLDSNIGSSMESHISHYVANQFGSRPKGYSSQNISKYIDISNYHNNGFNIYNLYTRTYDKNETIIIDEKEINYSLFEKSQKSNIPIINNGENTNLFKSLNGLSHDVYL